MRLNLLGGNKLGRFRLQTNIIIFAFSGKYIDYIFLILVPFILLLLLSFDRREMDGWRWFDRQIIKRPAFIGNGLAVSHFGSGQLNITVYYSTIQLSLIFKYPTVCVLFIGSDLCVHRPINSGSSSSITRSQTQQRSLISICLVQLLAIFIITLTL